MAAYEKMIFKDDIEFHELFALHIIWQWLEKYEQTFFFDLIQSIKHDQREHPAVCVAA